jgi:hypothetical protein
MEAHPRQTNRYGLACCPGDAEHPCSNGSTTNFSRTLLLEVGADITLLNPPKTLYPGNPNRRNRRIFFGWAQSSDFPGFFTLGA